MPAPSLSTGVAALTLSHVAPPHLSTRRGTHAHCFEVGTSPGRPRWAQGQEQVEPSLPLSQGGSEWGPTTPPPLLHESASYWPFLSPCCFSVCLITKQKLHSGLLYFYM